MDIISNAICIQVMISTFKTCEIKNFNYFEVGWLFRFDNSIKNLFYQNDDEDGEEYDVEAELRALNVSENLDKSNSSEQQSTPKNVKVLRTNKDSEIVTKIHDILAGLNSSTSSTSKAKKNKSSEVTKPKSVPSEDSGISDEENDDSDDDNSSESDENELVIPALPSNQQNDAEESDSTSGDDESDEEIEFRAAMFKEVAEKFYKNQSSVSYLRKFIYEDGELPKLEIFKDLFG